MPLTVEDGTGVPGADTWVTVTDAKTYAAQMGYTAFADGEDELVEPALRRAVAYLDAVYGTRYAGWPTSADPAEQTMSWPRTGVIMDSGYELLPDVIPANLMRAQTEAAVVEFAGLSSGGGSTLQPSGGGGAARGKKSVSVGPISVTYDDPPAGSSGSAGSYNGMPIIPSVDGWMQPLLDDMKGNTGVAFLLRA